MLTCNLLSICYNVWDYHELLCMKDVCQTWLQACVVSLLGNSIQFLLKYKTLESGCLYCTVHTHHLFCLPVFGGFVWGFSDCLKVEMSII